MFIYVLGQVWYLTVSIPDTFEYRFRKNTDFYRDIFEQTIYTNTVVILAETIYYHKTHRHSLFKHLRPMCVLTFLCDRKLISIYLFYLCAFIMYVYLRMSRALHEKPDMRSIKTGIMLYKDS